MAARSTADDVALLQYTGGTTGPPKGAMLTHGNLTVGGVDLRRLGQAVRAARGDVVERVICVLPLFHIYALDRGAAVLAQPRQSDLAPSALRRRSRDARHRGRSAPPYFPGVPTMWIAIAALPDLDKRDFSSLATIGSGGAPLPVEIANFFERKVGKKLRSGWGMTETCSPGTGHPPTGRTSRARSA